MIKDIEAFRHMLLAFRGTQVLTVAHRFVQYQEWKNPARPATAWGQLPNIRQKGVNGLFL
jgi:hypothetical protein